MHKAGCEEIAFAIRTFPIVSCVTVEVRNPHPYASANQIALYKGREIKRKKWCFLYYERNNIWAYA